MAQQNPEKETPWMGQVVLARLEDWEKYDAEAKERVRTFSRATLRAQAVQAGVHPDTLGEPTETKDKDAGVRLLTLKGTVDRGRPPHAGD